MHHRRFFHAAVSAAVGLLLIAPGAAHAVTVPPEYYNSNFGAYSASGLYAVYGGDDEDLQGGPGATGASSMCCELWEGGYAAGQASLDGTLKAVAGTAATKAGLRAHTRVRIWDAITFSSNGLSLSPVPMNIRIHGVQQGVSSATYKPYISYSRWDWEYLLDPENLQPVDLDATGHMEQTLYFDLLDEETTLFMYFELLVKAGSGFISDTAHLADFGNTLRLSWDLPEGVTYTSASGLWNLPSISDGDTDVPAPAGFGLAAAGFVGVAFLRRRRAAWTA